MNKNGFLLDKRDKVLTDKLSIEQKGILFDAIMKYVNDVEVGQIEDGAVDMLFSCIKEKIDRDAEAYDQVCKARAEAGAKGGRPRKRPEEAKAAAESSNEKEAATERCENAADEPDSKKERCEIAAGEPDSKEECCENAAEEKANETKKTNCFSKKQTKPKKAKKADRIGLDRIGLDRNGEDIIHECVSDNAHAHDEKVYGEFENVFLSNLEYTKLSNEYGIEKTEAAIELLSSYQKQAGKAYDDSYAAIKHWVITAVEEREAKKAGSGKKGSSGARSGTAFNNFEARSYDNAALAKQLARA